jgi:hypothetical protein
MSRQTPQRSKSKRGRERRTSMFEIEGRERQVGGRTDGQTDRQTDRQTAHLNMEFDRRKSAPSES